MIPINVTQIILGIYAVLMIVGGGIGYATAKSKGSLIAGVITGVLIALMAVLSTRPGRTNGAFLGAGVIAFVVAGLFVWRFVYSGKAMPAVPLFVVSAAVSIISFLAALRRGG